MEMLPEPRTECMCHPYIIAYLDQNYFCHFYESYRNDDQKHYFDDIIRYARPEAVAALYINAVDESIDYRVIKD